MKVAVRDTYVKKKSGEIMHFDILVPDELKEPQTVFNFGLEYLKTKPLQTQGLTSKECQLCHIEEVTIEMIQSING